MVISGMTKRRNPARFLGGPLHGQEREPATKWPMYLTLDGGPLSVAKGDRIMRRAPHKGTPQSCYLLRRDFETGDITYHVVQSATH